jgi:hypothetical protein
MFGHQCRRCGQYWASQANPNLYRAITVFCPACIQALPLVSLEKINTA